MEPVNPLGAEARAYLDAYRRQVPARASVRRDWSRVAAAIEAPEDDDVASPEAEPEPESEAPIVSLPDRTALGRVAIAAGLAVAIAAAVLLLLRGVVGAATALGMNGSAPMEAVDRAEADGNARVAQATARAARSHAATDTVPSQRDAEPAIAEAETAEGMPEAAPSTSARALDLAATTGPEPTRDEAPAPVRTAASPGDAARLAEETRLLRAAREALAAGDPVGALRSLADHEKRFSDGALVEERMLYRAIARCRKDGPDPTEAAAFLRGFPTSPHAPRVKSECGDTP